MEERNTFASFGTLQRDFDGVVAVFSLLDGRVLVAVRGGSEDVLQKN
jgi:hypothetical protein